MANAPTLKEPIPAKIVNEGAAFSSFKLTNYIQSDAESGPLRFQGELKDGSPLPKGLICTGDGIVSGIPANGTQGNYEVVITAENDSGVPLKTEFKLTIKSRIALETAEAFNDLKTRIWDALGKDLAIPELEEIFTRPISANDIYYLLQRFATLTIWDVYNLEPAAEKKIITVPGSSPHYNIYDRGSCIIGAPKDLFSHERTLEDALQTARAMASEVYKRGWVIEFAGFDKMARAAWIEIQLLGDKHGKVLEVLHYTPTEADIKIYTSRSSGPGAKI